jgi:hypothetical protein
MVEVCMAVGGDRDSMAPVAGHGIGLLVAKEKDLQIAAKPT